MAECSQKFKDMLTSFYAEAYDDGKYQCELSAPALEKEHAILQYVADELLAAAPEAAPPTFLDMTGGMP